MNDARATGESRERLLDAAERLFGELGFDGVGMRALADEAGVNLGAATYHFGGKQGLYEATLLRRFQPTQRERSALLTRAEEAAGEAVVPLEVVLDCFLRPPFMTSKKHPNFVRFLSRNLFMPPPFMVEVIRRETAEEMMRFGRAFSRALPDVPFEVLRSRIHFCLGALLVSAGRPAPMFEGEVGPSAEETLKDLVAFCAAGLRHGGPTSGEEAPSP